MRNSKAQSEQTPKPSLRMRSRAARGASLSRLLLTIAGAAGAGHGLSFGGASAVPVAMLEHGPGHHEFLRRVQARGGAAASLNVGSVILAEPASDTPLPIQVGPAEGLPKNSFIRIRGLPASVALSEGHSIAPGSWAVPFVGLPTLRLNVPVGLSGRSDIVISLVTVDGMVLAEAKSSLVIASASALTTGRAEPQPKSVASIGPSAGLPGDQAQPSRPTVSRQPPRTPAQLSALRYVTRGNEQLREGDIAAARLFFQRAVDAGLSEGALAMAMSYDPAELERLGVKGLTGDRNAARRWYERAREMGASEADERLRRLGGG